MKDTNNIHKSKILDKLIIRPTSEETGANIQVSYIATNGALFLAFGAFIVLSVVMPFSYANILAGICLLNVVFHNLFAERIFGYKIKKISDIYCVGFLMLTMPIQWFGIGGFHGCGALWMIFASIYCMFGIIGKTQRIMLRLYAFEVIAILAVNVLFPELEVEVPIVSQYAIGIASTIGIGAYIEAIILIQNNVFIKERKKMIQMQEDISQQFAESVSVNNELMSTTQKLEIANRTQKSFTASMNHELRSPLNGIEGCLQILLLDDDLGGESRETVKNALTACKTINQTVNDLLDFSKLDEGKFEVVNRAFDLRDILDNMITIFRPLAAAKNLKLVIQIPKESRVMMYGDGNRIQQIMTNLISNGIKYTPKGSVTMTIKTMRGHLQFEIKDTGQGMDEECIKTLFDPFTRFNLNENVNIQGTGLGMNIVNNLVKVMEGTIDVESRVGVGTTFRVDIPILFYDSSVTYSSPRKTSDFGGDSIDLSDIKVLYVDDTEINRTVFKGMLYRSGAYVCLADKGTKAIELCEEQNFDIVFMDHYMPEMDGIETMESIRSRTNGRFDEVPFIMFTGNSKKSVDELYREHGAAGSLRKPVMYNELIDCFRNNLPLFG